MESSNPADVHPEEEDISPYDYERLAQVLSEVSETDAAAINESEGPPSVEVFQTLGASGAQKEDEEFAEKNKKLMHLSQTGNTASKEDIVKLVRHMTSPGYGRPLNEQLAEYLEDDSGGLIYHAKIYKTGFYSKSLCIPSILDTREHDFKPRRPMAIVYEEDFFLSLNFKEGKWIFQGKLNGWQGLNNLELVSLDYWYSKNVGPTTMALSKNIWNSSSKGHPKYPNGGQVFFKSKPGSIRATLRAPKFTDIGYSLANRGFVWWYRLASMTPRFEHGENLQKLVASEQPMRAVKAHFYSHRYAKKKETPKDQFVYHTGVLLEWDHGKYCTNVELAFLYGTTGYMGRSNWCNDTNAKPHPELYNHIPDVMKCPWVSRRNEVRLTDMDIKNGEEFLAFLQGNPGKFLKPAMKYSGDVRLTVNSADMLVKFLINYSLRDTSYTEEFHNCQNFAADFFGFLCARTDIEPFYPIKLLHRERRHHFMYEPSMFVKKKKQPVTDSLKLNTKVKKGKRKPSKKEASGFMSTIFG